MNTSLEQMAEDYFRCAKLQTELICQNRKKLTDARKNGNFGEIYRLEKLLKLLYRQKFELLSTAETLKSYYQN